MWGVNAHPTLLQFEFTSPLDRQILRRAIGGFCTTLQNDHMSRIQCSVEDLGMTMVGLKGVFQSQSHKSKMHGSTRGISREIPGERENAAATPKVRPREGKLEELHTNL